MRSSNFRKAYQRLNAAQREAVDAIEGPVMVIAGPGTGKTTVLTLRIANILEKTDTAPENILALTFTEAGVYQMRKSLVSVAGSVGYRVPISTFHGFANRVINEYPEQFDDIIGARHIDTVGQLEILEDIVMREHLSLLAPSGNRFFYVQPIQRKISELKKDAITPDLLEAIIASDERAFAEEKDIYHKTGPRAGVMKTAHQKTQKNIEKSRELLAVYRSYERRLREGHLYDYEDMIVELVRALSKNREFLLMLEEQYQYLLADEHQDANRAQNEVLRLLSSFHAPYPNLFLVGDEKQAIYRFQGASLANFLYFKEIYPNMRVISLTKNYRSTGRILEAADALARKGPRSPWQEPALVPHNERRGAPVTLIEIEQPEQEPAYLAREILKQIKGGVHPDEIAVLYRDNKDAFPLAEALSAAGVPVAVESDPNALDDEEIRKLILLLRAVHDFGNDEALAPVLYIDFLGFDNLDLYRLTSARLVASLHERLREPAQAGVRNPRSKRAFKQFAKKLSQWKTLSANRNTASAIEIVAEESGFIGRLLGLPDAEERLAKLDAVFREVERLLLDRRELSLGDFLRHLDLLSRYNLRIGPGRVISSGERVHLLTAHSAKGREFGTVYIVGAYDGHWGSRRSRNYFPVSYIKRSEESDTDDERRLFYVALSRAEDRVVITYAKRDINGRERLPARFIEEIGEDHIEKKEASGRPRVRRSAGTARSKHPPRMTRTFLQSLFRERGLSVTAYNNYLACPWHYFYKNLLRVPQAMAETQHYGNAVHKSLERYFTLFRRGEDAGKDGLLAVFRHELSRAPLERDAYEKFLEKGTRALSGYYDMYRSTWDTNVLVEYSIRGVDIGHDVQLTGKLDKIEFSDGGRARVVDYKTGTPRSRAHIEGKTKSSNGDYKRQLVFYKLLVDSYPVNFTMETGVIDFVEPDTRGKYRREEFHITDDEVKALRRDVTRVADEIRELSFWNTRCGERLCRYCRMSERAVPLAREART